MRNKRYKRYTLSLILMILFLLFLGLSPKQYDSTNNIVWDDLSGDLTFQPDSLVYGDDFDFSLLRDLPFTIKLTLEAHDTDFTRFSFILNGVGHDESDQLLIGQWDRSLVLMNGTDYSNRRREPKLYVPLGNRDGNSEIILHSSEEGTKVYIDGELIKESRSLRLTFPGDFRKGTLILGNGIARRNPWSGTMTRLTLENSKLSWDYKLIGGDNRIKETNGTGPDLLIPQRIPLLKKVFLAFPDFKSTNKSNIIYDVFINFFGFIPLGIILSRYLSRNYGKNRKIFIPLLAIFLLSLTIETIQVWLPARHSSILDLLLNTSGGAVGYLISLVRINLRKPLPERKKDYDRSRR